MSNNSNKSMYDLAIEEAKKNLPKLINKETGKEEDFLCVENNENKKVSTQEGHVDHVSIFIPEWLQEKLIKENKNEVNLGKVEDLCNLLLFVAAVHGSSGVVTLKNAKTGEITLYTPEKEKATLTRDEKLKVVEHTIELFSTVLKKKTDTKKTKQTKKEVKKTAKTKKAK